MGVRAHGSEGAAREYVVLGWADGLKVLGLVVSEQGAGVGEPHA